MTPDELRPLFKAAITRALQEGHRVRPGVGWGLGDLLEHPIKLRCICGGAALILYGEGQRLHVVQQPMKELAALMGFQDNTVAACGFVAGFDSYREAMTDPDFYALGAEMADYAYAEAARLFPAPTTETP